MRVGVSVFTHTGQSIWENGLGQNVFFLVQLLRTLPLVTDVVLLNCGNQERLDTEWLDHLRSLGKKVVFFCRGQPYAGLAEPGIFQRQGYFSRAQRCDEIWIFPKDRLFKPLLETLHRCPVREVPFLWHPLFVKQRADVLAKAGFPFGYVPREQKGEPRSLRTAVFEPNSSVLKCCAIPMLVCDSAYRAAPESVAHLRVLNSIQFKEHPTFACLTRSLSLYKHSKIHLDHRHDFVGYMSQFADAVVAHQWQNEQNILHLDALYGGYALIHNSPWLAELGYYYEDSDIQAGGQQLLKAARQHDAGHASSMSRNRAFLTRLSPYSAENCTRYSHRLLHLSAHRASRGALC
jgi:hypothetical protein